MQSSFITEDLTPYSFAGSSFDVGVHECFFLGKSTIPTWAGALVTVSKRQTDQISYFKASALLTTFQQALPSLVMTLNNPSFASCFVYTSKS